MLGRLRFYRPQGTNYYKHYATALRISAAGIEPLAQIPREKAMPCAVYPGIIYKSN